MSQNDLLALIDTIYQAGLEPDRWWDVLARMTERFRGTATLFIQDPVSNDAGFLGSVGMDEVFMREYDQHFASVNPARLVWPAALQDSIIDVSTVMEEEAFFRTEFYNDFFRPMGVHHAMGVVVRKDEHSFTNLGLQRAKHTGEYTDKERRELVILSGHIRRSIDVSRGLTAARWMRDASISPVKSIASGFVFVNTEGRVLLADAVAERVFRDGDGLTAVNGRLQATCVNHTECLLAMIREAASTASRKAVHSGGPLSLPRLKAPPLTLLVCPWHGNPLLFGVPGPAVLIFIEDLCLLPQPNTAWAAALYRLTPAETRLLDALVNGQQITEYAATEDISITTARTHLQRIFAKTGQRRQADLLRMILTSGLSRYAGL